MFEKEAEKWVKENMDCCKTDNSVNQSIPYFDEEERCCAKSAFQDGAEFGYNKANEELEEKYKETICNSELNLASVTEQLEELEKANEWHDLRKDPTDLPKEVGNYIVCFLDTSCERHTFELSFVDYFEDKHWIDEDNHNIEGYDEGVIAWCEIPTFDKE